MRIVRAEKRIAHDVSWPDITLIRLSISKFEEALAMVLALGSGM
jgi:hypothetical protein